MQTNIQLTNFTPHTKGKNFTKDVHKSIVLIQIFLLLFQDFILFILLVKNENSCEIAIYKLPVCKNSDGYAL